MHTIIDPHDLNSAAYFKSASYFIFMYDVCDLRSFKGLSSLSLRSRSPTPPLTYTVTSSPTHYAQLWTEAHSHAHAQLYDAFSRFL